MNHIASGLTDDRGGGGEGKRRVRAKEREQEREEEGGGRQSKEDMDSDIHMCVITPLQRSRDCAFKEVL